MISNLYSGRRSRENRRFTMDVKKRVAYDVLIIGAGNAGLVAAIEARNHGASVLLLEKGPRERRGGNSRLSGGHFRIAFDRGKPDFANLLKDSILPKGEIEIEPYTKDAYYSNPSLGKPGIRGCIKDRPMTS